jgi:hypothetical protein
MARCILSCTTAKKSGSKVPGEMTMERWIVTAKILTEVFDARDKLSDDGNTILEEVTEKSRDGKEIKTKTVWQRTRKHT